MSALAPDSWLRTRVDHVTHEARVMVDPSALGSDEVFHYSIPSIQELDDGKVEPASQIASLKLAITDEVLLVSKLNPDQGIVLAARPRGIVTVASSEFVSLRAKGLSERFLRYLFMSHGVRCDLVSRTQSATKSHRRAKPDDIRKLWFWLPPRTEQLAISDFLDSETARIDALIDRKQRFIDLLLEKRTALITHAVTKGLDPNVEMKDSGIPYFGAVPQDWNRDKLGRLGSMSGGCTPSKGERRYWDGDIPWVTPKDMKIRRLAGSIDHVTDEALAETSLGFIEPGAVLIVVRGMILARLVPVAVNDVPVTMNQDMKAIRLNSGQSPEYMLYMLEGLQAALQTIVEEAAHGTRCLRTEAWNAFPIMLPPLDAQLRIVDYLDEESLKADAVLSKTRRSIELLREYRTALISAAVTGQIDIPETETSEEVA